MFSRSGSANLSPALNVRSKTARVSRLRILTRTSVWPPRAVGLDTSTSRQTYGAFSNSKNIFRLMPIASIMLAMRSILASVAQPQRAIAVAEAIEIVQAERMQYREHRVGQRRPVRRFHVQPARNQRVRAAGDEHRHAFVVV